MATRRDFIERAGALAGAAALGMATPATPASAVSATGAAGAAETRPRGRQTLRILILGGTGFIGPYVVRRAIARGHEVTLFNRGQTNVHLFPHIEKLVGDRNSDLSALEGRIWDAVVDNSGYNANQLRLSVDLLRDACDQYLFTSTRAVYYDFSAPVMNEDAPLGPRDIPESEWVGYGPHKVLAERVVREGFAERTLIARPPVVVGPGDLTDRFTYWVDRIDDGGEVMVWGDPSDPVQFIDVRDLAEFYINLLEHETRGVFNTNGPEALLSSAELVYGIRAVTAAPVSFTWVDWDFLAERGLQPQNPLPFWHPPRGRYLNYGRMDSSRAIAAGLRFRPLAVTARQTLDWHRNRQDLGNYQLRMVSPEVEARVLAEWKAAQGV